MTSEASSYVALKPQQGDQGAGNEPALRDSKAVAMSGGGYRAMLFHLGFLWRMRDAGILKDIERFSSVSGGSITAGMLAVAWPLIDWNDDGRSFRQLVADPLLDMSLKSIDIVGGLLGRIPGLNGSWVRGAYDKYLYKNMKLRELTGRPRFVFNATSLHTGKLVRINQEYIAEWSTGMWDIGDLGIADAVAASSAFPPVLSPVVFDLSKHQQKPIAGTIHQPPAKLSLADGGVYDNLGLEAVWKRNKTIYVSNAGVAIDYRPGAPFLLSTQAIRVTLIMMDQIGSLRFRQMLHSYSAPDGSPDRREGFLVSSEFMLSPRPAGSLPFSELRARELAATPTVLRKLDPGLARQLVNWGYISTDDRLRQGGPITGPSALPFPNNPVH